jgi:hypothetical protein
VSVEAQEAAVWNPKIVVIIIIIRDSCALGLNLVECHILSLSVSHWVRYCHWVLKGRTIGSKQEARGLEGALELRWPDQLREDVAEIVRI